jgi:hypothetical protein
MLNGQTETETHGRPATSTFASIHPTVVLLLRSNGPALPKGATKAAKSCLKFPCSFIVKLSIDINVLFTFEVVAQPVVTLEVRSGDIRNVIACSIVEERGRFRHS